MNSLSSVSNELTILVEVLVLMYPLDPLERSSSLSGALIQQAQEYDQVYLLKELEHLADFTIVIEESHPGRGVEVTKIPCNKFVLTKRSNYFSAMFEHGNYNETKNGQLVIKDFDLATVQNMIQFIYEGKLDNQEMFDSELLKIADKYFITLLKEKCEQNLAGLLEYNNIVEVWKLTEKLPNAKILKNAVVKFLVTNWKEADKFEGLETIWKEHSCLVKDILKHMSVQEIGKKHTRIILQNMMKTSPEEAVEIFC